jgi:hypothetical protein
MDMLCNFHHQLIYLSLLTGPATDHPLIYTKVFQAKLTTGGYFQGCGVT